MSSSRTSGSSHKKVLLMGKSGSGKTSMRSIIFESVRAEDTKTTALTHDIDSSEIKFLAGLKLNLWDCGGQDTFMDSHLTSQSSTVFRSVHSLIYIFDVGSPDLSTADTHYFLKCLGALKAQNPESSSSSSGNGGEGSGGPTVFVLLHKMDLLAGESVQANKLDEFEADIKLRAEEVGWKGGLQFYGTSIWNETLYKAWSVVVSHLMPSLASLRSHLKHFLNVSAASEVVLFERQTFLVIASVTSPDAEDGDWDDRRFERVSNVVKTFKLAAQKARMPFSSFTTSTATYTAVLDTLTPETYILVVAKPSIQPAAIALNINLAKPHFSRLEATGVGK